MMYHIFVYVPETHLEAVKDAMFKNGGGRYERYDRCSWQVLGEGQFRPLAGSRPFLGSEGRTESAREYRVEMVCPEPHIRDVVQAMLEAHPYEEPAYGIVRILTRNDVP
jgi:hypothetical protein